LINHSSKLGLLPTNKSEEIMKPFATNELKSLSKFLQSLKKNKWYKHRIGPTCNWRNWTNKFDWFGPMN